MCDDEFNAEIIECVGCGKKIYAGIPRCPHCFLRHPPAKTVKNTIKGIWIHNTLLSISWAMAFICFFAVFNKGGMNDFLNKRNEIFIWLAPFLWVFGCVGLGSHLTEKNNVFYKIADVVGAVIIALIGILSLSVYQFSIDFRPDTNREWGRLFLVGVAPLATALILSRKYILTGRYYPQSVTKTLRSIDVDKASQFSKRVNPILITAVLVAGFIYLVLHIF